jgi:hypothetical protein
VRWILPIRLADRFLGREQPSGSLGPARGQFQKTHALEFPAKFRLGPALWSKRSISESKASHSPLQ